MLRIFRRDVGDAVPYITGMFESLGNKKNGNPKVSVLVRQKGLVCVFAREWAKTDVRLRRAVAGGAHPRRILMFESQ